MGERINDASERLFQDKVRTIFQMAGWQTFHPTPHLVRQGVWRSDGKGFPDLVCAHPKRGVLFAELKAEGGRVSEHQELWRIAIEGHVEYYLWRPSDLQRIAEIAGRTAGPRLRG